MPPTALRSAQPTSLIGAPTDIGAGARGASMGPEALRVAGLQAALESHGLQVFDRGNLSGPANPWLPPVDGYRHLPEVVEWNQRVFDAMYAELQLGHLPILLGGDHCLGLGSISAVARHCAEVGKKLRVLWLEHTAPPDEARLGRTQHCPFRQHGVHPRRQHSRQYLGEGLL